MKKQVAPIIRKAQEGRPYLLGEKQNTKVLFKADGQEVDNKYAITEWWMKEGAPGPAPHT